MEFWISFFNLSKTRSSKSTPRIVLLNLFLWPVYIFEANYIMLLMWASKKVKCWAIRTQKFVISNFSLNYIKHSNEYRILEKINYRKPSNKKQDIQTKNNNIFELNYGNTKLWNVWSVPTCSFYFHLSVTR